MSLRKIHSTGFALLILVTIFLATTIAVVFPHLAQPRFTKEIEQFLYSGGSPAISEITYRDNFASPVFVVLVALLSVSLLLSILLRTRAEFRRRRHQRESWQTPGHSRESLRMIQNLLRRHGLRTLVKKQKAEGYIAIKGIRGEMGIWGSIVFHMGLLVFIAGIAAGSLFSFDGSIALTEGQRFDSSVDHYGAKEVGCFYTEPREPLVFQLLNVQTAYSVNGATTVASFVKDGRSDNAHPIPVFVNHGLTLAGRTIHQGAKMGYSPQLVVTGGKDDTLFQGYLRLASTMLRGRELHRDFIALGSTDLRLEAEVTENTEGFAEGAPFVHASQQVHVRVLRGQSILFDCTLSPGESVSEGLMTVSAGDIRRWMQFDISDDLAIGFFLWGSLLAAIGLAVRLSCTRREVCLLLHEGGGISFDVREVAEKYPATFREEAASIYAALVSTSVVRSAYSVPPRVLIEDQRYKHVRCQVESAEQEMEG